MALQAHEKTRLIELFASMCLIRAFEERVSTLYRAAEIPGFMSATPAHPIATASQAAALG